MADRNFFSKLYRKYGYDIFPRIKHLRGATRLKMVLKDLALKKVEKPSGKPVSILEKEWDNLIIIDACRHDLYEEVNGETKKRTSLGSATPDYIKKTFTEEEHNDIVYVTANPQLSDVRLQKFIGQENPFHAKYDTFESDWDEENSTVMPGPVVRDALSARELFPDKRLIIHFVQPHYPFVNSDLVYTGFRIENGVRKEGETVWYKAEKGEISRKEAWEAYKENLELVMPAVEELSEKLDGRTVVTSDHGNLVGENGLYGHPKGKNRKPLKEVPWDVRE